MPRDLAEHLDAEAARRATLAGVKVSRTGALIALLREHRNGTAPRAAETEPAHPPGPSVTLDLDAPASIPKAAKAPKPNGALDDAALRKLCKRTKLSQRALAAKTDVAQSTLSVFLKGGTLSPESREKVTKALHG